LKIVLFSNYLKFIKDFIAPPVCEICGETLQDKNRKFEFICNKCYDALPLAEEPDEIYNKLMSRYGKEDIAVSSAVSLFSIKENNDYIKPIYSLKYYGFTRIGTELGKELGRLLKFYNKTDYDYIVPVPIHHARLRERGYNQSEFIANGISSFINVPVNTELIKRKRYTQTQTVLSKEERRKNIEKAIVPYKDGLLVDDLKLLIVDDVLTTGSTMNVCAKTLLKMGAKNVEAASIVHAG
jgi:ComF family protein